MESIQKVTEPILYHEGTNREAILLLHGFAVDISNTDLLFRYFSDKGYTVARPVMPGHTGNKEDLKSHGPDEWLEHAQEWLTKLETTHDKIFLLGISFGSNLAVSLTASGKFKKIAGLVVTEMPIYFAWRIWIVLSFIQPVMQFLGFQFVSKAGPLYRKNHTNRYGAFNLIPVKIAGQINRYVKRRTRKEIGELKVPVLVLQAEKSDLLNSGKGQRFVCEALPSDQRKIYCLPIDNHDLNILDEEGKIVMLERIYDFIKKYS